MRILPGLLALFCAIIVYFAVIDRRALIATGIISPPEAPEAAQTAAPEPEADKRFKVVAKQSIIQQIDSAVVLRGQTQAKRQVQVRAETTATVLSEPLRKGRYVEAGALLCELDPGTRLASRSEAQARQLEAEARATEAAARVPEAEARLTEARARLEEAKVNQNAAQRLSQEGFASETRVKNADAALASAEAAVEGALTGLSAARAGIQSAGAAIEAASAALAAADKEIERLQIRAPFAGMLESDTAELGSLLQAGGLCATVMQLDPIKLVAFVPETEVARIEAGALAGARLAAGGREVAGTVTFLSRAADPTTRTFRVEVEVPNTDQTLRDGMTAEILIQAEGTRAHKLPGSAMTLNASGALGIRAVQDGKVKFMPVELVRDTPDGVWLAGLPDMVDVIVVGQEYVTEGVTVDVTYREE